MSKIKVIELFAGVGGFRLGLEGYEGKSSSSGYKENVNGTFETVFANQYEPSTKRQHAAEIYVSRFGKDGFNNLDINEIEPSNLPEHDLLVGGFPCFVAGTMILTEKGFLPIEKINKGDVVLTHTGKWKKVTATMSRYAPSTLTIRGQGFPDIQTTDEHPFWSVDLIGRKFKNYRSTRVFSEPNWVEAKNIKPSKTYLSQITPKESAKIDHDWPEEMWSEDLWWIVGRYLADGWLVSKPKGRVVICSSKKEMSLLKERIRRVFNCSPVEERAVFKFHITRQKFHDWLVQFGHKADGKNLPSWVYNIPKNYAKALLEGYSTGDGCLWQRGWKATTVSKSLSLSISLLVQYANNVVASIHEAEVPSKKIIEGRTVNQKKQYQIVVPPRNRSSFIDGNYGWKLVRSVKVTGSAQVFNISVEDDESYIANGCIVHNCQDYSIANTLKNSKGLLGKKGVLWWSIHRILSERKQRPDYLFFENVDRLINSPSKQRGRDFAIILRSLSDLGYAVEWRVINAADYGMPQRRRRTFILGYLKGSKIHNELKKYGSSEWIEKYGVLQEAFPTKEPSHSRNFDLGNDIVSISLDFNKEGNKRMFDNAGLMMDGTVTTEKLTPDYDGPFTLLKDIIQDEVQKDLFLREGDISKWKELKGAKSITRKKEDGFEYQYSEGGMSFPDDLNKPSRTIITGEGGSSASRFKHVIQVPDGLRRLSPVELERLNMFPDGHTEMSGITDTKRAFFMGNAMVVGIVERIGKVLSDRIRKK